MPNTIALKHSKEMTIRQKNYYNPKIVLNWNMSTQYKLCNGTTGTVKDIIFAEGENPSTHLPIAIVIEFPLYDGPAFFDNVIDPLTPQDRLLKTDRSGYHYHHKQLHGTLIKKLEKGPPSSPGTCYICYDFSCYIIIKIAYSKWYYI